MRLLLVCCLLTCVALEATPLKKPHKEQLADLQYALDRIIQEQGPACHIGMEVISLKNGERLYQKNSSHLFVPASNLKLLTAAAALHTLGIHYQFETEVFAEGQVKGGKLHGNLYLKGSGDPELTVADLADLALQLKEQGITEITGDLIVDHSDFDDIAQGPGWMWDDGGQSWSGPVSALPVNHNCIEVCVTPAKETSKPPIVRLFPETDFVTLSNRAKTSEKEEDLKVERAWMTRENKILINGKIPLTAPPQRFEIGLDKPHLYTAALFLDQLQLQGIVVRGCVEVAPVSQEAQLIASHLSPSLSRLVEKMMKESDNLIADCLFKKLGQTQVGDPGTWQRGAQAVRLFLAKDVLLDVSNMVVLDGSGLSRYNLVSPHQIVQLLTWTQGQFSMASEFLSALPISGVDGTLQDRLCNPLLRTRIRAKTGAMTGISGICGYITTKEGELLAFSVLINGFVKPVSEVRAQLEDRICQRLVQFKRE